MHGKFLAFVPVQHGHVIDVHAWVNIYRLYIYIYIRTDGTSVLL